MIVIRCIGFANGQHCPHEGQYVSHFDHEAWNGRGFGEFTSDPKMAKKFNSIIDAIEFCRLVPKNRRFREDGKPNRPMTAMNVEFEKMES